MIKKLDILIIRSFIGPFIGAFAISLFVLTMQFFWLYIDDLVGKGLDTITVLKLVGLVTLFWVPTALPLSLLFSSIMTFGNLGESFELVAIKAAGIPLLRFMRPLLVITLLISGLAFLFANNIIPVTQLKLSALKYNIIVSKPALDIKPGVFYDKIDGYVIKLGSKEKNDSIIHDVVIFEKSGGGLQDQMIKAESGIMRISNDQQFLEFILKNGWRHSERGPRGVSNTEYMRMGFNSYKKVFDLKSFQMNNSKDSSFYDPKMLSVRQLNVAIDSLYNVDTFYLKKSGQEINPYLSFTKYADTGWHKADTSKLKNVSSFAKLIPDSIKSITLERASNQVTSIKGNIGLLAQDYETKVNSLRLHEIEWHRKFTLSVACLVLFLIGAPLGSIIRKGGLGTPLVFAIIFFVIFHLFNTFGEKFVKSNSVSPLMGMWLSTFILIPIGFFLTYKAMRDSQLFNQEFYYRSFKQLRLFIAKFKRSNQPT
ncbi:MAG: LptF/LptG family permease [Chitinophagaceae bacterium]|nr:LptF/LptG family permease [Chitinophagaceae bacterium]